MRQIGRLRACVVFALLALPLSADSLQKKTEDEFASATGNDRRDRVLDTAIQEGLAFPPGTDLASYLAEFQEAYLRLPAAWAHYVGSLDRGGTNAQALRRQFLGDVHVPLSAAYMALARHHLQSRKSGLGYGLDISEGFHQDLDRAIVYKNASALHAFFFQHLAKADVAAEAKDPSAVYRGLLVAEAQDLGGYTVTDFKDIFYFQAPEASADYLDEEIFSLYRTLKEQTLAVSPMVRLVGDVARSGDTPLAERHQRLKHMLGALTFGTGPTSQEVGNLDPPSMKEVQAAATGWALRQGLMRTLLLGEHLAYEYARCLQKPGGIERLRNLQKRLGQSLPH